MEELIDIHDTLHGRLGVVQFLPFGNGICQISPDMCPAGCPFCVRDFVVSAVAITHQIAFKSMKEVHRIVPCTGLRVFIEDDRRAAIFTTAEKPHVRFCLCTASRFMEYLQGRFILCVVVYYVKIFKKSLINQYFFLYQLHIIFL